MEFEGFAALKIPLKPQQMLANTGTMRLNVHPISILLATSKVLGWMNPYSSLGRPKVHNQHERKAARWVLSLLSLRTSNASKIVDSSRVHCRVIGWIPPEGLWVDLGRDLTERNLEELRCLGKNSHLTCLLHQKSIQRSAQTLRSFAFSRRL